MLDKEKILKDFEPLIKSSIKKYFKNNQSYEDAFQDGLLKVLMLIEKFNKNENISLECFLKYQLKFFYMQKYFKQKSHLENTSKNVYKYEDEEEINIVDSIEDENENVENEILENERNSLIKTILLELPEKQRQVIEYKFFEKLKNKEIAEKMLIKEDTVKEYYKIAKKKLKTKFEEKGISL